MPSNDEQTAAIDQAINASKAARATETDAGATASTESKPKRRRLTPEERETRDALREKEKAERKAAREAASAAKKAEREANRKPPHMSKVEKAAAKLPIMSPEAQEAFDTLTAGLESSDMFTLTENLRHHVRVQQTTQALNTNLTVGQVVTIVGGNRRFIGQTATVAKVQRIRCYVDVQGYDKPVYLFLSDCQPLDTEDAATVGEEDLAQTG